MRSMIRRLWTMLVNTSTWQRAVIAFVLGFAATSGGYSQLRFLLDAFHHGGF